MCVWCQSTWKTQSLAFSSMPVTWGTLPYTPSPPPPARGRGNVPSYTSLPAHSSLPAPGLLDSLRLGRCGMCLLTNLREEHFPGAAFNQKGVEIVG